MMEEELGLWGLSNLATTGIIIASSLLTLAELFLAGWLGFEGGSRLLWRLYCIYFLKLRWGGKIVVTPFIPLVIAVVSYALLFIGVGCLIWGLCWIFNHKIQPLLWSNEVQCKGYHCERGEDV